MRKGPQCGPFFIEVLLVTRHLSLVTRHSSRLLPPSPPGREFVRFVDAQRLPLEILAVQSGNGSERVIAAGHLDETETFSDTGKQFALHFRRFHLAEGLEQV